MAMVVGLSKEKAAATHGRALHEVLFGRSLRTSFEVTLGGAIP